MSGFLRKSYSWLTVIYPKPGKRGPYKKAPKNYSESGFSSEGRLFGTKSILVKAGYSEQKAYLRPVQDSILLQVTSEPSPSVVLCNFHSARTVQRWNRSRPRNLAGRDSLAV